MRGLQERRPVAALTPGEQRGAVEPTPAEGWRRPLITSAVAAAALAADQASKSWAERALANGPIELFWTLRFRLTFNTGAAFSLGRGLAAYLVPVGLVLLVAVVFVAGKARTPLAAAAAGLVLGGAMGNLTDRLLRSHDGAVVDFIDFQWWPVFNLADIFLVTGIGLLLLTSGLEE